MKRPYLLTNLGEKGSLHRFKSDAAACANDEKFRHRPLSSDL
jgi:hypothetical protein